jgi:hypothetical protein
MKILLNQAEKCAMEFVQGNSEEPSLNSAQALDLLSPKQSDTACYTAELHVTINRHHDSVLQLLKMSATIDPQPDFSTRYDEIRGASFPIISGLATLIMHLGGEEISVHELKIFTHQAEDDALELHTASTPPKLPSPLGWEFQFLVPISGTPIIGGIPIPFTIPKIPVGFFFEIPISGEPENWNSDLRFLELRHFLAQELSTSFCR